MMALRAAPSKTTEPVQTDYATVEDFSRGRGHLKELLAPFQTERLEYTCAKPMKDVVRREVFDPTR